MKKTVELSRRGPSMRATRSVGKGNESGDDVDESLVEGIEHKPQLSEAVLRAVGLHGGDRVEGSGKSQKRSVRDLRDTDGALHVAPPKTTDDCSSVADVVAYLSHKYRGYFERTPFPGRVSVRFTYGDDADVYGAGGATTRDAVRALAEKFDETFACLEDNERVSRAARGGDDNE